LDDGKFQSARFLFTIINTFIMKKVFFTLVVLMVSTQLLFSQSAGKVVYGPKADQSDLTVDLSQGNAVVYDANKRIAGYEPRPTQPGASDAPVADQFSAYVSVSTATSFTVTVVDAPDCAGTYTVSCSPIAGSGPGGSTPPLTNITAYIGFPQGNFFFGNAGEGEYAITVTNTNGACSPPVNPLMFKAWPTSYTPIFVPVAAVPTDITVPSFVYTHTGYTPDGHFYVSVSETGSCVGTYSIFVQPVANSAPDGTTPPNTVIIGYIGFPAGNFLFQNAGVGRYHVSVTQTNPFTICNYTDNPLEFEVEIPDIRPIPVADWALALGIALIAAVAFFRIRRYF